MSNKPKNRCDFLKHLGFHSNPPPMSNKLCKCRKVGEISCPHDDRCGNPMSNTDNTLPEELRKTIRKEAESAADKIYHRGTLRWVTLMEGWEAGATEYAPYKVKFELAVKGWEEAFKYVLKSSKAFTDAQIDQEWMHLKAKHNL